MTQLTFRLNFHRNFYIEIYILEKNCGRSDDLLYFHYYSIYIDA